MKFARLVFYAAGVWGIVILTPLFFLVDVTGRRYAAPDMYPQFYYGFLSVAMAWQFAFLMIGSNPVRFRLLMVPAMIEKFGYVSTLLVLLARQRIPMVDFQPAAPDFVLGLLFIIAFVKTAAVPHTVPDRGRTPGD